VPSKSDHEPEALRGGSSLLTLIRGLAIIDAIAAGPADRGVSHASLARQLGFQRSTLYRYLGCLQELGFVEPADEGGRYRLGPKVLAVAAAKLREKSFPRLAKGYVNGLSDGTGETAHATIYDDGESVTLEIADGAGPVGPRISIGSRRAAHSSASGKVFLAHEDGLAQRYMARMTAEGAVAPGLEPEGLMREVRQVRAAGYALDQGEVVPGICCVAAPVFDLRGRPAGALSISVATRRLSATRIRQLLGPLLEATATFSRELGYRADEMSA
jgi:IclR family transcriptional regulator, KDG regulon repressor